jgi:hypothetical protein
MVGLRVRDGRIAHRVVRDGAGQDRHRKRLRQYSQPGFDRGWGRAGHERS